MATEDLSLSPKPATRFTKSTDFAKFFLALWKLPVSMGGLTPIATFFFVAMGVISALRSWKTAAMLEGQTSLNSLRELPSKRFENLLGEAYRRQAYKVKETLGGGADGGIDLLLERNGQATVVECKRWKGRPVPVQIVRELYGVLHDRGSKLSKIGRYDEFHTGGHCIRERKTNRACRCGRSFVSASNCSKIWKDSRASCCRGTRSPHARLSALRLGDEAKNGKTRREYRTEVLGLL